MPSQFTTWGSWKTEHPDTLALDAPGDPTGFDLKDLLVVIDFSDDVRGYAISDLRNVGVANGEVAAVPLAVVSATPPTLISGRCSHADSTKRRSSST